MGKKISLLVFGVESVLWTPTGRKGGQWYKGVVLEVGAQHAMEILHNEEAARRWERLVKEVE